MAKQVAVEQQITSPMLVELKGVTLYSQDQEKETITLMVPDVRPLEIHKDLFDLLNTSGIPRAQAMAYAEEIVQLITTREIARAIAERVVHASF